jgi:hypothetical protein
MPHISKQLNIDGMPAGQLDGYSIGMGQLTKPPIQEAVFLTPPPDKQVVWKVYRALSWDKMYRANLIMSLREKYGKEAGARTTKFYWLFDSEGRPAKMPGGGDAQNVIDNCVGTYSGAEFGSWFAPNNLVDHQAQIADSGWCNTIGYIVVADVGQEEILQGMTIQIVAMPVVAKAARSETAWIKNVDQREYQRQVEESKKAKPSL